MTVRDVCISGIRRITSGVLVHSVDCGHEKSFRGKKISCQGLEKKRDTRVATGQTRVAIGQTRVATGQTRVATGQTRVAIGQTRVAIGQTRVATGQTRVAIGQTRYS